MTHICVSRLTIICSDNGLSPGRRQAIIWTNAGTMLIGPFATNYNESLIEIYTFSFRKMHVKMLFGKCRPFRFGLNVLTIFIKCLSSVSSWIRGCPQRCRYWFLERHSSDTSYIFRRVSCHYLSSLLMVMWYNSEWTNRLHLVFRCQWWHVRMQIVHSNTRFRSAEKTSHWW